MRRVFGEIEGCEIGKMFANRQAAAEAGVHRNPQAGIVGGKDGAESVVLAGGYSNEDDGDTVIYTGEGGRDQNTGVRNGDQKLTRGNLGLSRSIDTGLPVRVLRGARAGTRFSPKVGYRYSGLYRVTDCWRDTEEGWLTWRFRLEAIGELCLDASIDAELGAVEASSPVRRMKRQVSAQVRQADLAQKVKEIYGYKCQICNVELQTPAGPYAEAAHVRGLGQPHNGPDSLSNILCLCPNDHLLLDRGAIGIRADTYVFDTRTGDLIGKLNVEPVHKLNSDHLTYHAMHIAVPRAAWSHARDNP